MNKNVETATIKENRLEIKNKRWEFESKMI